MKNLLVIVLLPLSAHVAQASELYHCKNNLPSGESTLVVTDVKGVPSFINLKIHNNSLNADFDGVFTVSYFVSGSVPNDGIVANGAFTINKEHISAVIQGSLTPNENGDVFLSVGAGGDERIEYGYGLTLACKKQ
jgi:hypothetical protein